MNPWTTLLQRIDTTRLRQRWHALAPRERLALAALAAFLLGLALYGGLWLPVERQRAQALADFQQQRELLAYLQARAPEARSLGDRAEPSATSPTGLQRQVTAAAEGQGLTIERLDAAGEEGVQVSLRPAPFATLLAWFEVLQRQGIRIEEAGLERQAEGLVVARLGLRAMP